MSRHPEWLPVAYWEASRTLQRKDFLFSVLFMPVLLVGIGLVMAWFKERGVNQRVRIAVVGVARSGAWSEKKLPPFEGFTWVAAAPGERPVEALKRAVGDRRYDGAVLLPAGYADHGGVQLIVRRSAPGWKAKLETFLSEQARLERAAALGLTAEALERLDARVKAVELVTSPAGKVSRRDRLAGIALTVLLIMALYVTVSYMAIGITGEKQARVTEVVVSAIRPQSWIDGKIVAFTSIGLAQAILWAVSWILILVLLRAPLIFSLNPVTIVVSGLLFLLGLLLYVALYALVLATIKDLQSTSKIQAYLYLLPIVPFIFIESVVRTPDALWVMIVSQIPFFSPFVLPARMAVGAAGWWEIALALVLLAVTAYYVRLWAGTAFRIGMLMYGKELTLPELVRWAKQV